MSHNERISSGLSLQRSRCTSRKMGKKTTIKSNAPPMADDGSVKSRQPPGWSMSHHPVSRIKGVFRGPREIHSLSGQSCFMDARIAKMAERRGLLLTQEVTIE